MSLDQTMFIPVLAESLQTTTSPTPLQFFGILLGLLGLFFFVGTAVGMIRFPDFYTRMHAAGKGDTLSTMLMLSGFGLVSMEDLSMGSWLLFFKIMGVVLFIFITCPTSSHALMRAAFEDDEMPMTEKDLKKPSAKKK